MVSMFSYYYRKFNLLLKARFSLEFYHWQSPPFKQYRAISLSFSPMVLFENFTKMFALR